MFRKHNLTGDPSHDLLQKNVLISGYSRNLHRGFQRVLVLPTFNDCGITHENHNMHSDQPKLEGACTAMVCYCLQEKEQINLAPSTC